MTETGTSANKPSATQAPGRQTLVQLVQQPAIDASPSRGAVRTAAEYGTVRPPTMLPAQGSLQRIFGRHDISGAQGEAGDRYEQYANHAATLAPGMAARAPGPLDNPFGVHLPAPAGTIQRKETGGGVGDDALAHVARASASTGAPLSAELRAKFEGALGADLSGVRVHQGADSAGAAQSIAARAYTIGQDIHFAAGAYAPESAEGEHLLAHEVAHTVQQAGDTGLQTKLEVSSPGDAAERGAAAAAAAMVRGEEATVSSVAGGAIARAPQPGAGPVIPARDSADLSASMFSVEGGIPTFPGVMTAAKEGNKVRLFSPKISCIWTVTANKPPGNGERFDVGPIQTLIRASRVGVYREGGKKDGAIVAEHRTDLGEMRDVSGDIDKDAQLDQSTVAPFYSQPETLNARTPVVIVQFEDRPKNSFPVSVGNGKLTETKGEDSYVTSLSAKKDDNLVHLQTFKWQVPWALKLDDGIVQDDDQGNTTAQGLGGGSSLPEQGVAHGEGAVPILAAPGATHMDFQTQEAADAASVADLIKYLPNSKANPTSQGFIVEALKKKNPTFHITLTVDDKNSLFGNDSIEMRVKGQKQVVRPRESASKGGKVPIMVQLNEIFDNLAAVTTDMVVSIEAQDKAIFDGNPHHTDWGWPWSGELNGRMQGFDGVYSLSCTFW
jgi:hypothetical protein